MDDNVMYAWEVLDSEFMTHHICLRKDIAEYLCDWCNAIYYNHCINYYSKACFEIVEFSISECEVIL